MKIRKQQCELGTRVDELLMTSRAISLESPVFSLPPPPRTPLEVKKGTVMSEEKVPLMSPLIPLGQSSLGGREAFQGKG